MLVNLEKHLIVAQKEIILKIQYIQKLEVIYLNH